MTVQRSVYRGGRWVTEGIVVDNPVSLETSGFLSNANYDSYERMVVVGHDAEKYVLAHDEIMDILYGVHKTNGK